MRPSGYLSAAQAADYLKFPTLGAFHAFLYRRRKAGVPVTTYRKGGKLLFTQADLDAALSVEQAPRHLRRSA